MGLAGKHPDGRYYDRLPGRLIFPIFSPNGRVVAFAGRVLDPNEKGGKYINSPESIIYNKSRILYGLSFAKDEIRRLNKAIIVEGYMDLISLYQNGVKNVVAVSGTALTDEQVQLLSRYTKDVVLLFDADTAGIKASMRSIEILLKRDMEVKIVSLPQGEDPDSFVNKFGKDKFEDLLKKAENFIEFQTRYFEAQGMFNDSHTAAETIREVVKPLALINDELKRNLLIKNIARKFNLREKLLEAEFDKVIKRSSSQRSTEIRTTTKEKAESTLSEEITEQKKANPVIYNLEKDIIKLLFEGNSSILNFIHNNIKAEDFAIKIHMRLAKVVYEEIKHEKQIDADKLIEDIKNDELQSYVREIVFEKHSISSNWEERNPGVTPEQLLQKYTKDIVLSFKLHKIDKQIKENHNKIENTELEEDTLKLMSANRELAREKDRLREKFSEIEIE